MQHTLSQAKGVFLARRCRGRQERETVISLLDKAEEMMTDPRKHNKVWEVEGNTEEMMPDTCNHTVTQIIYKQCSAKLQPVLKLK